MFWMSGLAALCHVANPKDRLRVVVCRISVKSCLVEPCRAANPEDRLRTVVCDMHER